MAERVFVHLGVPKSATTYLQSTLWAHRDELREQGVLLPGERRQEHTWASFAVRGDPVLAKRERVPGTWDRLLAEVHAWPGTAVLSHEFLGAASAEQARKALAALAPAEVHLVVTARNALALLTASWQETLKYRSTTPLAEHNLGVSDDPLAVWDWRNLDAAEVLSRWAPDLPPERVHVVVLPRHPQRPDELWHRFAGLFLPEPDRIDSSVGVRNESMGVVESELLRSLSTRLTDAATFPTHGWLRDYVAARLLVPRAGEAFHPSDERIVECRERSRRMVQRIEQAGYQVLGDLDDLLVPHDLPPRRTPDDVTAEELANASTDVLAAALLDLRTATSDLRRSERRRRAAARKPVEGSSGLGGVKKVKPRIARVWRRS